MKEGLFDWERLFLKTPSKMLGYVRPGNSRDDVPSTCSIPLSRAPALASAPWGERTLRMEHFGARGISSPGWAPGAVSP